MTLCTLSVDDMHCSACAGKIQRTLSGINSIKTAHINLVRRQVFIEHDEALAPLDILSAVESAGFSPALSGNTEHDAEHRQLLKRLGIAGLGMMQVMMVAIALYAGDFSHMEPVYKDLLNFVSLLFATPVVCYSAVPFFTSAIRSIRSRGLNMDVPIALAIAIAFSTSLLATVSGTGDVYYDSVVMFTFLLLGARYINAGLQHRFDVSSKLLSALPANAWRLDSTGQHAVAVEDLRAGDRIWVAEGERIPVDGRSEDPQVVIDEAVLSGESDWVEKRIEDRLYAGTLNLGKGFAMSVTARFDQSRIADIARLADQAEIQQASISQLTDRIARVFIPAVLVLAAITGILWQFVDPTRALSATLTVLVVSCPCALSLATPAALTAAMTRLRQLGIVLTNSHALETINTVDKVYLDKTGTLTAATPGITATQTFSTEFDEPACLALAAQLERYSNHAYAKAFHSTNISPRHRNRFSGVTVKTGEGVSGILSNGIEVRIGTAAFTGAKKITGDRGIYLAFGSDIIARFDITNSIRPDASAAVTSLKTFGITPIILSGDSRERCKETAANLGIAFLARHTPEAKLEAIRADQSKGSHVLMLGDGINDVPVLAGADVSAAVMEASDLVKSKADILLLSRKLTSLADLFRIARATRTVTIQNLAWATAYNLTAIPFAALGLMPPWLAALGMATSSTLVMLNASRLLYAQPTQKV